MRVLLAVDGSQPSRVAARAVTTLHHPGATVVRVLCVAERVYPPPPTPWVLSPGASELVGNANLSYTELNRKALEQAETLARNVASSLAAEGLESHAVAAAGDPWSVIVEQATEWDADCVVVGSHGRTGFQRWVLGSVAEAVVRHAPCSVHVVRDTRQAATS